MTFEIEGDDARISAGSARASVRLLPADEFPRVSEPEGSTVTVDAEPLAAGAAPGDPRRRPVTTPARSSPVCCSPRPRPAMRLVATDSYRLAVRDLDGVGMLSEGQKVLVGARGLNEVQRVFSSGQIDVTLGEREVKFAYETRIGDHATHRRRLPELRAADPERLPEQADGVARARSRKPCG